MEKKFQIVSIIKIGFYQTIVYSGGFNECVKWMEHNAEGFDKQNLSKLYRSKNEEEEFFYM